MKVVDIIKEYFIITLGVIICAFGVYFFLVPSGLTIGSVSGLGLFLEQILPFKLSQITFVLNAVLLIIGFIFIGKDFGVKTVYTSLMLPVFIGVFEKLYPVTEMIIKEQFGGMICYLFIVSVGQAIMFNCNASSGGLDIVGKIINKYFRVELGKAIAMVGMGVAALSVFMSDAQSVALSLLGTYISGIILDHFIFGFNIKKRVCFLSDKSDEIVEFILKDLHSGATYYNVTGAYDKKEKREVLTIVNKNEYSKLMNFISKTDPNAFVTVYNVNEVIYRPKV